MLNINEIKTKTESVAKAYNLNKVILFGSYARNEANEKSDVDLLVDLTGANDDMLRWYMADLFTDFKKAFNTDVDILTTDGLDNNTRVAKLLKRDIENEGLLIYER